MRIVTPPEDTTSSPEPWHVRFKRPRSRRTDSTPARSENSRLYRQLTPAYEIVFPLLIRKRIWESIRALNLRPGARVLEVGVGTGISLGAYPRDAHVTGIDLSEEMLAVARRKVQAEGWDQVSLLPMNAERLEFPDSSFDCVTAFHVVSVVSQPQQMMREITRVLRPGGKMLIINHFRSERRWIANVIDRADPVTRHLGWRTDLELDAVVDSLPLEIEKRYKTSPLSLFTVLRATRTAGNEEQA